MTLVGIVVAFVGGFAAGVLLHELHVVGHPERRMRWIRSFLYLGAVGALFYVGQAISALTLGVDPEPIMSRYGLWLVFSAASAASIFLLGMKGRMQQ